jgi:hypothetical protein
MTAGPHYLRTVLDKYGAHCHQHRPHQAKNLRPDAGEVIAALRSSSGGSADMTPKILCGLIWDLPGPVAMTVSPIVTSPRRSAQWTPSRQRHAPRPRDEPRRRYRRRRSRWPGTGPDHPRTGERRTRASRAPCVPARAQPPAQPGTVRALPPLTVARAMIAASDTAPPHNWPAGNDSYRAPPAARGRPATAWPGPARPGHARITAVLADRCSAPPFFVATGSPVLSDEASRSGRSGARKQQAARPLYALMPN